MVLLHPYRVEAELLGAEDFLEGVLVVVPALDGDEADLETGHRYRSLASLPFTPQFAFSMSWNTTCTWSGVVLPIFTMASVIAATISRFCWSVRPAYHCTVMFGMARLLSVGRVGWGAI